VSGKRVQNKRKIPVVSRGPEAFWDMSEAFSDSWVHFGIRQLVCRLTFLVLPDP
jgi:hypothetical protein